VRAVNLLPRDESRGPGGRRRMTGAVQLALVSPFVIGSLLAAGYLLTSSKVNDKKATLQALQEELAAIPPRTDTTSPQTNAELALQRDQRIAALGSALQARIGWDRILREISSVLPEDVWLTSLSAVSPQAPVAAPAVAPTDTTGGQTDTTATTTTTAAPAAPVAPTLSTGGTDPLSISGYTYSQEGVARFLSRLSVIPELQNVKLVSSAQVVVDQRPVIQFSITADLRGQGVS
jgi:Tfp pilus assembly protein PilN